MRFLSIDYGTKRTGYAISDETNTIAVITEADNSKEKVISEVKRLTEKFGITKILIGYPLNLDGSRSKLCEEVDKLKEKLSSLFNIPVELIDERFSSKIAEAQIIESIKSRKKRRDKNLIDKFSAAVILQEYLNSLKGADK